jgi:L-seryl-tRNA(Ser) seleniumtransferase
MWMKMTNLRDLPSIEQLLQTGRVADLTGSYGRLLTLDALRQSLNEARIAYKSGGDSIPGHNALVHRAEFLLGEWTQPTLQPVINATGVILHTNLGRAPLSRAAVDAMRSTALGYSSLEYDLPSGKRGSRLIHAEQIFRKLTGAEAVLVVNNNASAVLLALSVLAKGKKVVISRTQLVEIGGSFRIPDVMKQSGAKLAEVGTTNKVHLRDYKEALVDGAALVMRAHRSNFKIVGFTEEPALSKIAELAHEFNVPLIDDLGSGALLDTEKYGLGHEPTVQESLSAGADLVCFSGDKLLGGPQAGIIIGRADLLEKIKKHPLTRAVRSDKLCLAALSATLLHYLKDEAIREIPIWRMISESKEQIKVRAEAWRQAIGQGQVLPSESTVGGGSLPEETLPTFVLSFEIKSPDKYLKKLRLQNPPIIARTVDNHILFDPRTVLDEQGEQLVKILHSISAESQ